MEPYYAGLKPFQIHNSPSQLQHVVEPLDIKTGKDNSGRARFDTPVVSLQRIFTTERINSS